MFAADARRLTQIEPALRRVLIVEPSTAAARLLWDVLKGLGTRNIIIEPDEYGALEQARQMEPSLIFTERLGQRLDGERLVRTLRRSSLSCRMAPIIMVTADATAASIKGARDVGVHEFLRKPFTSADLFRRIETVALKPRDWIEAVGYVGPDRRRFNAGAYAGPRKRRADTPLTAEAAAAAVRDQAMLILAASVTQFDTDPSQALRAIRQQAETLAALAMKTSDTALAVAAAGLSAVLAGVTPDKAAVTAPVRTLLGLAGPRR